MSATDTPIYTSQDYKLGAVAFLVIIALIGAVFVMYSCSQSYSTSRQPLYEVTADDLLGKYQSNEVAADNEFRGKTLVISGEVLSIRKGFTDTPIVELATSQRFTTVDIYMATGQADKAGLLIKGQMTTFHCPEVHLVLGHPSGSDCEIS